MILGLHGHDTSYAGRRLSAQDYFALGETEERYELIDGVVCMSPGPFPVHGSVIAEITAQIVTYLKIHPIGRVFVEVDVSLGKSRRGGDLVYRPDLVVLRADQVAANFKRIVEPPAIVVEVVSESSRRMDRETKKGDYERFGVAEYWVIDSESGTMAFHRLQQTRYVELPTDANTYRCEILSGFALDLAAVRAAFRPG